MLALWALRATDCRRQLREHVDCLFQAGWLRLNMGNIQMEQEQYALAVKMYRMALDQLPPALKRMRLNVQRNIGIAFLRAGRFQVGDAARQPGAGCEVLLIWSAWTTGVLHLCLYVVTPWPRPMPCLVWLVCISTLRPRVLRPTAAWVLQDACDTFASIMTDGPDHQTGFNLAVCCWAMRDVELMKQAFLQLIQVETPLCWPHIGGLTAAWSGGVVMLGQTQLGTFNAQQVVPYCRWSNVARAGEDQLGAIGVTSITQI